MTTSSRTSRWRRLALPAALVGLVASVALSATSTAGAALNPSVFELDGNASTQTSVDWDEVYRTQSLTPKTCPTGASACSFVADGSLTATIFTGGGSKDPIDIPSWKWKDEAGGLPDKDNLVHAFAARYPSGAADLLYFGSDRHSNEGDAHQAFWFFQNEVKTVPGGTFSGVHKNGDLLVISEFSNGGTVSTIVVYKWNSAVAGNLQEVARGSNAKCSGSGTQDFCGIVNAADGTVSPWPFVDKFGSTTFRQGEFFEGGIDLNAPGIGLGGQCFASFSSETRSSTSTSAVLKDFVLGGFGRCGSTTVTTPKLADGTTDIGASTSITTAGSVQVRDSAEVTVSGSSAGPTGSVSFSLCGPTAPSSTELCAAGGASVGTTPIPAGSTSPVTVVSPVATVTSAGRYCFRADYSGDPARGIPTSSDSAATECFLVTPVTPGLTTTAGAGPVNLGSPITDTAALTGTANRPGSPVVNPTTAGTPATGTLTFSLRNASCQAVTGFTNIVRDVTGDGTYPTATQQPVSFVPTAAGTYNWVVTYSGDDPNTTGVTHNAGCTDTAERVVVQQLTPAITTAQSFVPNDSATVTVAAGGGDLSGTVVFELFDNVTCTGTALYTSGAINIVGVDNGSALTRTVSSSNTTAYGTDRVFSWRVTYTSTNGGHTGATHSCGIERSSIAVNNTFSAS